MTSSNKETKRIVFKIGDEDVDMTDFPPFTLGDKKKLKKLGLEFSKLADVTPEQDAQFVLFTIQKMRPKTTMEEVDNLPTVIGQQIVSHAFAKSAEVEGPLSPPSTQSDGTTGGGEKS